MVKVWKIEMYFNWRVRELFGVNTVEMPVYYWSEASETL